MTNFLNIESDCFPFFIAITLIIFINWIYSLVMSILWFKGYKFHFPKSFSIQRITFLRFYFGKSIPEIKRYFLTWNYLGTIYFFSLIVLYLINGN